jgi:hypothetical protein
MEQQLGHATQVCRALHRAGLLVGGVQIDMFGGRPTIMLHERPNPRVLRGTPSVEQTRDGSVERTATADVCGCRVQWRL